MYWKVSCLPWSSLCSCFSSEVVEYSLPKLLDNLQISHEEVSLKQPSGENNLHYKLWTCPLSPVIFSWLTSVSCWAVTTVTRSLAWVLSELWAWSRSITLLRMWFCTLIDRYQKNSLQRLSGCSTSYETKRSNESDICFSLDPSSATFLEIQRGKEDFLGGTTDHSSWAHLDRAGWRGLGGVPLSSQGHQVCALLKPSAFFHIML